MGTQNASSSSTTASTTIGEPRRQRVSTGLADAIAGFSAGFVSTVLVHPMDLVRTRLQIDRQSTSTLGSSLKVIRGISESARASGTPLTRAFYRGITPNLIGNTFSWCVYFYWYGQNKKLLSNYRQKQQEGEGEGGNGGRLSHTDYLVASGVAGVFTSALTNPIWVVKTRMMSTEVQHQNAYKSFGRGLVQLAKLEGFRGLYRGFLPSMLGVVQAALQFMSYEELKNWRRLQRRNTSELSSLDFVVLSSVSKVFSVAITYPYQVVRTRLQMYNASHFYRSARDVVGQTWKAQGITGFYRGLMPNLLRVLPATCITFLTFENTRAYLLHRSD